MATRLRLRFRGQRLTLLLKAVIFFVALWFAATTEGRTIPLLFFAVSGLLTYFSPFENVRPYRNSFLILLTISVTAVLGEAPAGWFLIPAGMIAYGIFGLKARYFISRERIHHLVTLALTYGIFFVFFAGDRSEWFMLKLAVAGIAIFAVWKEFFLSIQARDVPDPYARNERLPRYETILGALFALITAELALAVSFLPISGMNAANLSFLGAFVLGDILEKEREGILSRHAMLAGATVVVLGTIFILATSSW